MSMMRGFFTVGFWTMVSRVLGFFRDIFIAGVLGASPVAEAFVIVVASEVNFDFYLSTRPMSFCWML